MKSVRSLWSLARNSIAALGALLLLITFTPVVRLAAGALATDWYEGDGDVLVILGGSMLVRGTRPDAALGYDSYLRCVYAGWYIQRYTYRYVVLSGADGLAQAMAKFLKVNVVELPPTLLEPRAHSTYENAVYVKALLEQQSISPASSRIVILTSDFHSWRARRVFEHCGMHVRVIPVPDVLKRSASLPYRLTGFFTIVEEVGKSITYAVEGKL